MSDKRSNGGNGLRRRGGNVVFRFQGLRLRVVLGLGMQGLCHVEVTPRMAHQREQKRENAILGGPWDLVTIYNWAHNPTYNPPTWAYRGYIPQL